MVTIRHESFNFHSEFCCDQCEEEGSIEHFHFDCPACGVKEASSSVYGEYAYILHREGDSFSCQSCETEFSPAGEDSHGGVWSFDKSL